MTDAAQKHDAPPVDRWPLRGGAACLDFANTVAWRPLPQPVDGLSTYDDLLTWGLHAGLLSPATRVRLRVQAASDPAAASVTLARSVVLREAIHRLFAGLADDQRGEPDDLESINAVLAEGMARSELVPDNDLFAFQYRDADQAIALPLWMLAESAAQLLVSGDWRRVRACPGHDCGWLFLDQTKNGNRRWCDSTDCGNRARVRAHYQRQRAREQGRNS